MYPFLQPFFFHSTVYLGYFSVIVQRESPHLFLWLNILYCVEMMHIRRKHLLLSRLFHSSSSDNLVMNSYLLHFGKKKLSSSLARAVRGQPFFRIILHFSSPHPLLLSCMDVHCLLISSMFCVPSRLRLLPKLIVSHSDSFLSLPFSLNF